MKIILRHLSPYRYVSILCGILMCRLLAVVYLSAGRDFPIRAITLSGSGYTS